MENRLLRKKCTSQNCRSWNLFDRYKKLWGVQKNNTDYNLPKKRRGVKRVEGLFSNKLVECPCVATKKYRDSRHYWNDKKNMNTDGNQCMHQVNDCDVPNINVVPLVFPFHNNQEPSTPFLPTDHLLTLLCLNNGNVCRVHQNLKG